MKVKANYPVLHKAEVGLMVDLPTDPPITEQVKPACKQNHGYWYCVTHRKSFRNQSDKDQHIGSDNGMKEHTMAWMCWTHGLEQP